MKILYDPVTIAFIGAESKVVGIASSVSSLFGSKPKAPGASAGESEAAEKKAAAEASRKQRAGLIAKSGRQDTLLSGGGQPTSRRTVLGAN